MTALFDFAVRFLQSRFFRFALVGTAGFVVDEVALVLVHSVVGLDFYSGQVVAFFVSVTFTWWGNRVYTFHENAARTGLLAEWGKFVAANGLGAVANYALYAGLLRFASPPFNNPYLAVAVGTLFGFLFNFTLSKRFVFQKKT